MNYICNAEITIEADSPREAAQEYVDSGDYSTDGETTWVNVTVTDPEDGHYTRVKITVDPEEPDCSHEDGHEWEAPFSIVGGIRENPGVHGHGGGVTIHEVCCHCGCHRHRDTWAQDPEDGTQGLESVRYEDDADDDTRDWMLSRRIDEIKAAIEAAGLEPDNLSDMVIAVPDEPDTDEAEKYLAAIRAALPDGIEADWTGNSDTNGDGETTSDLRFCLA